MAQSAISQHIEACLPAIPAQPKAAGQSQPIAPAVPAGFRLVPTLIGRPGNVATVWIQCPTWCHIDHANDRQVAVEDVWHSGDFVDLELPHRGGKELLAYFRLGLDPYSSDPAKRRTFVYGEDGDSVDGRYMDPQHIRDFCDRTEAAIAQLRALAEAAEATAGDSDPDMDEALRRVRQGGAV
ncbi:hypothetical protein SRB17_05660 [Streptomyces sp. RB17]|uniref:DUF6907 domain-containing protein n=1 Tax=Streptomyces sp. RB17 TaxID=2585197 RepID=UPI0012972B04|nr:hypothetical protein [Streptomyces sp. RB17]MQY32612.1 hypothetical protein [Streptomyces sp. RB17]